MSAPDVYDVIVIGTGPAGNRGRADECSRARVNQPVAAAVGEGTAVVRSVHEHLALAKR